MAEMWRRSDKLRLTLTRSMLDLARYPLESLASRVGTPFYFYDGDALRSSMAGFAEVVRAAGAAGRYAM
jgi:diaminopimelate decarboxylase